MTDPKWTPGPWSADEFEIRSADRVICEAFQGEEDATLIAAAPELYEALNNIVGSMALEFGDDCEEVIAARAALAKARGESDE